MKTRLYMRRLKRMIERAEHKDDVCQCCPVQDEFVARTPAIKAFRGPWGEDPDPEVCIYCRNLVATPANYCPCDALGPKEAVKRARKAIKDYEKKEGIVL